MGTHIHPKQMSRVLDSSSSSSSSEDIPIAKLAQNLKNENDSKKSTQASSSDSWSSDSSDDEPIVKKAKKQINKNNSTTKKSSSNNTNNVKKPKKEKDSSSSSSSDDEPLSQKLARQKNQVKKKQTKEKLTKKALAKIEEEEERNQYKWWLEPPLPKGKKWKTLQHNGPLFAPPYQKHNVKMLYDGEPIDLDAGAEELATFYSMYLESAHVKKDVFNKNFFKAFKQELNKNRSSKDPHPIQKFELCDFRPIRAHLM